MASSRLLIYITDFQGHFIMQQLISTENRPDLLLNVKEDVLENTERRQKLVSSDDSLSQWVQHGKGNLFLYTTAEVLNTSRQAMGIITFSGKKKNTKTRSDRKHSRGCSWKFKNPLPVFFLSESGWSVFCHSPGYAPMHGSISPWVGMSFVHVSEELRGDCRWRPRHENYG